MFKKIIYIFYLISFTIFVFSIAIFYFSEQNIIKINKLRSTYSFSETFDINNLPSLKSDTINIIEYSNDIESFKQKKKKYKFWNLIK